MQNPRMWACLSAAISMALISVSAAAQGLKPIDVEKSRVIQYWTEERRANAIPRDLAIDPRGLGYLRRRDGSLQPYGHEIAAQDKPRNQTVLPFGGPNAGSGDGTPPTITMLEPGAGATVGASATFKATVKDTDGIKSVTFNIQKSGSSFVNSFSANNSGGDDWTLSLTNFTDGTWSWWVVAKDGGPKGGSTATSDPVTFTVSVGGSSSGSGSGSEDTVTNKVWDKGGTVQTAAGRLYFEMPSNSKRKGPWTGYVCSGTVATDDTITTDGTGAQTVNDHGRSVIITAAHCVYDDLNKAFARNVMFIPNQAGTSGTRTDRDCSNDPLGCWVPSFGVVDVSWTTKTFPDNIAWDYALYVVDNTGAHQQGITSSSDALDTAAGSLTVSFNAVNVNDGTAGAGTADFTHALGYSYSEDPKFMYCAEDMTTEGAVNWWLPSCGMSGGSSGGPWVQPMDSGAGSGPIISVNSWGYTNSPGMAGPKLSGTSAQNVFGLAVTRCFPASDPGDGAAGVTYPAFSSWSCRPAP